MTNFKLLDELPIYNLHLDFLKLNLEWDAENQICLNNVTENSDDIKFGTGSLVYDWNNAVSDINGNLQVPKREKIYNEEDFKYLCTRFKNTNFEKVYNALDLKYKIGRVRLMRSDPKTCLTWHVDTSPRIHYPIKTQEGCFMVIDKEIKHLKQNCWYWTNTIMPHTAFNGSKETRVHLVATILE